MNEPTDHHAVGMKKEEFSKWLKERGLPRYGDELEPWTQKGLLCTKCQAAVVYKNHMCLKCEIEHVEWLCELSKSKWVPEKKETRYKYKDEILEDIGPEPNCNYQSESDRYYSKIEEIKKVYSMAERASKYLSDLEYLEKNVDSHLSKSKAFDEIVRLQGEFNCGCEYEDFYDDVLNVIHKRHRGEFQ